jgi:plastocyanin
MTLLEQRRVRWALALSAVVALLAAATLLSGRAAGANATASGAKAVSIVNFAFKPATVRIARGGKVAFANTANTTHTATGASFDTKSIASGKTATVRFARKGTFAYHCKIHPFMKGKVVVE